MNSTELTGSNWSFTDMFIYMCTYLCPQYLTSIFNNQTSPHLCRSNLPLPPLRLQHKAAKHLRPINLLNLNIPNSLDLLNHLYEDILHFPYEDILHFPCRLDMARDRHANLCVVVQLAGEEAETRAGEETQIRAGEERAIGAG